MVEVRVKKGYTESSRNYSFELRTVPAQMLKVSHDHLAWLSESLEHKTWHVAKRLKRLSEARIAKPCVHKKSPTSGVSPISAIQIRQAARPETALDLGTDSAFQNKTTLLTSSTGNTGTEMFCKAEEFRHPLGSRHSNIHTSVV